ncbi:MAG: phospholipase, partial [Proteobacteria bacterium]|nr:phospholipase [Pseudomonadota bacterium]
MNHPALHKFQFPWRRGNRFELLVDGHVYFPRMLEAIELARRYILLEIYLFESGTVANHFIEA